MTIVKPLSMNTSLVSECLANIEAMIRNAKRNGVPEKLPDEYWRLAEGMLREFCKLPAVDRAATMAKVSRDESGLLFGIAMGAATWSVREWRRDELPLGLLALIVEGGSIDYRETLLRLCVLNHSADKLGCSLEDVFADIRQYASAETCEVFDGYFRSGERDIRAMGYKEVDGANGFDYERMW